MQPNGYPGVPVPPDVPRGTILSAGDLVVFGTPVVGVVLLLVMVGYFIGKYGFGRTRLRCTKCKTINPEKNKHCAECGQVL